MMLLDNFYTILDSNIVDENSIEITVELQKNHEIFKGHFPNYPVTPGVMMLQIVKNCLESHLSYPLLIQASSTIKFLSLVNPYIESILIFKIQLNIENEIIQVKNNTSFKDGRSVLKCNVTFVKK